MDILLPINVLVDSPFSIVLDYSDVPVQRYSRVHISLLSLLSNKYARETFIVIPSRNKERTCPLNNAIHPRTQTKPLYTI